MTPEEKVLLSSLNAYANEIRSSGNNNMIPAIGRIISKLEESGKHVVVNKKTSKYELK